MDLLAQSDFEEGVLLRDLGDIARAPDVAIAELVANAWDAGAANIWIEIPEGKGGVVVVRDDGVGLAPDKFIERWMRYGYSRTKNQGRDAEFPPERAKWKRKAYGRNGMGRHALLCFADQYSVDTRHYSQDKGRTFLVQPSSGSSAFGLFLNEECDYEGHGTTLSTQVERNLPDPGKIRDSLSFKFLHDPQFAVFVNQEQISLEEHEKVAEIKLQIDEATSADIVCVKIQALKRRKAPHGVAFWVGGRLVGEPTYNLFGVPLLDGRLTISNQHMFVVKSDTLYDEVRDDWSAFKKSPRTLALAEEIGGNINQLIKGLMSDKIEDNKAEAIRDNRDELKKLGKLSRIEINDFMEGLVSDYPTISTGILSAAVKAAVNLEKSRSGRALLEKLAGISEEDVVLLDKILDTWSMRDALEVLEEIDRRLNVVQALSKLMDDPTADELHTIHPLVTQARWLFGPEFDSPLYSSNMSIQNAAKRVFKRKIHKSGIFNPRQRPDLIFLKDATLSLTGTENFDDAGTLVKMNTLLVIELKKGDSTINSKNIQQAMQYVEDLLNCKLLDGEPFVRAFVVGNKKDSRAKPIQIGTTPVSGLVEAATFSQLIRTANHRLFKLQERISQRYKDIPGLELLNKILGESVQRSLFPEGPKPKRAKKSRSRRPRKAR